MDIAVYGSGYVGLVTAACFAEAGHRVICVDVDAARVARLAAGSTPLHEPGLAALLAAGRASGDLHFTTDGAAAARAAEVHVVAVGTPAAPDGSAELTQVRACAALVAQHALRPATLVVKSTVPVGTAAALTAVVAAVRRSRASAPPCDLVSCPEFLREGQAVADCRRPQRVVAGCTSARAWAVVERLYAPLTGPGRPLLRMDPAAAELTKYAANAMLAARVALVNELARVCAATGADYTQVRAGIGSDPRIGADFLAAGLGYGGSCFPKDLRALLRGAADHGLKLPILRAVAADNALQWRRFCARLADAFAGSLRGRRIGVWGLAFKPGTDDVRESPALAVVGWLLQAGAHVLAHDPAAAAAAAAALGPQPRLRLVSSPRAAAARVEALAVLTAWPQYAAQPAVELRQDMAAFTIFDGCAALVAQAPSLRAAGCCYVGVADAGAHAPAQPAARAS